MLDPTIYLFNPENDLALGIGTANYTPAPNVREFHAAGAMLPLWYSRGMSAMILGDTAHADWLSRKCGEFGFTAEVIGRCDREGVHCAVPWGWSANAVRQLTDAGVPRTALPSDRAIERMRTLSHRRSAAWLAAGLARSLDYPLPVVPVEASSVDEVMEFVVRHGGCFIKSPWSGSGRGVIDSTLIPAEQLRNTASGIIRRQGSVMVEERLDKVMDFAMLFHIDAAVSHVGYSVFFNETANAYGGNRIMSDIRIEEMIESQVGLGVMSRITDALIPLLDELLSESGYTGYFGVDMMVYRSGDGELLVCPTVELNLRMTMGVVAWHLGRDILAPGVDATLRVRYSPSISYTDDYVISGGRMTGGVMSLVPPHQGFKITLSVD